MLDPVPVYVLDAGPDKPLRREPGARLALAQLALGLAIFAVCLGMPRPGEAVLLIPVVPHGVARVIDSAHGRAITVLRGGWINGSLLVRIDGDVPVLALLGAGVVPVGAPAVLCGNGRAR